MKRQRFRKLILIAGVICLAGLGGWRVIRHFKPAGAKAIPFCFYSDDGGVYESPGGSRRVFVRFNDGGAMHSGFHWTWIYTDHPLWGKRCVHTGYSPPDVRKGEQPLDLLWLDENRVRITHAAGRHDQTPVSFEVEL